MKKTTPIYDDSLEVQLTDMLCKLDENPIVNFDHIGSSSYKGHLLSDTEQGFQNFIHVNLYLKFLEYFENYKVKCINTYAVKTNFLPVAKRLFLQYENAMNNLVVLIRDSNPGNRAAAVRALGLLAVRDTRNTAAKSHLQYLKTNEKDPLVIQAREETMTKISNA